MEFQARQQEQSCWPRGRPPAACGPINDAAVWAGRTAPRVRHTQALTWIAVATAQNGSTGSTPLLDDWIAAAGETAVAAEVEGAKRRIDEGSLPSFDNPGDLLAFLLRGRRQSA